MVQLLGQVRKDSTILNIKDKVFYGWVVLAGSLIVGIISFGIRYSFGVFFKSLESEFDLTRAATSGIFAIHMIFCGIMSVIGGWVLDKYGPRRVAFVMGLLTGLSLILSSQVTAFWQLYITYSLILALGTGAIFSVANSTITRWFIKRRGLVIGIVSSGGAIGGLIMAPFVTFLVSNFNWRLSFIILGLIAWITIIPASLLLRKDPREIGLLPDNVRPGNHETELPSDIKHASQDGVPLSQAWKTREFWLIGLVWLVVSFNVHLILTHVVPHAIDLGISPLSAALILSLVGVGGILGRITMGRASDTIGRKTPAIACALLQMVAVLLLIWMRDLWMLYVFGVVFGYTWGGIGAQITVLISDIFGTRYIGAVMGAIVAGWQFGAAIGPTLAGAIFDINNSYSTAFAIGALIMLIATISLALIRPEQIKTRATDSIFPDRAM